mgnify:CR=1 FL=1
MVMTSVVNSVVKSMDRAPGRSESRTGSSRAWPGLPSDDHLDQEKKNECQSLHVRLPDTSLVARLFPRKPILRVNSSRATLQPARTACATPVACCH